MYDTKEQRGNRGYGEGDEDAGDLSQCNLSFRDGEIARGSKSSLGLGRQVALVEVFILLLVDLGQTTTLSESQGHHQLRAMNSLTDSCRDPRSEGTWNGRFTWKRHTHGRLLIMTPATLPNAKSLCRGTVRSSSCFPCLPAMLWEQSRDGTDTLGRPLPQLVRRRPPSFQGMGPGFELGRPSKAQVLSVQTCQH